MNIFDYFNYFSYEQIKSKKFVSGYIDFLHPNLTFNPKKYNLAIITINTQTENKILSIKNILYQLHAHFNKSFKIIDLGEIKKGSTFSDILFATRDICEFLFQNNIIPIIITDNSYIPYSIYLAYEQINKAITICNADYTFFPSKKQQHFLPQILSRKNHTLFNYVQLALQNFYTEKEHIQFFLNKFYDIVRLGEIHANIKKTEPFIRDSDVCILNSTVLSNEYIQEYNIISPSGLSHNEICQISKYAGISDKISCFCLYISPHTNISNMTFAQILWHFIEGYSSRINDYPILSPKKLIQYHVEISKQTFINFYKSPFSERWWFEIPIPKTNFKKKWLVACDEQDYIDATNGHIPDKWYKYLKKVF
ncbi:MAG: hypothetical protein N2449_07010 [Bacteroidales bacterium]|nr:hypothetical protein [Bacteroidales bacterium]